MYGASAGQRRERRRRRRNRQTVGETLGEGGTRLGERDQDDLWDDEDLESGGGGGAGGGGAQEMRERGGGGTREDLPQYNADSGLPAYAPPPPPVGFFDPATTSSDVEPTATNTREEDEVDALPTAAEYEALSRAGRDAPGGGGSLSTPTYPPPIHVHNPHLYPSEPPPSFSRANSGISTRSRRSIRRNPNTGPFTTTRAGEESEVERREREEQEEIDRERILEREMRRRESSMMTASSSASKLGDEDLDDETDSLKSRRASHGTGLVASGSRLTLDETKEKVRDDQDKGER